MIVMRIVSTALQTLCGNSSSSKTGAACMGWLL